jgi:hypothetical protein
MSRFPFTNSGGQNDPRMDGEDQILADAAKFEAALQRNMTAQAERDRQAEQFQSACHDTATYNVMAGQDPNEEGDTG